MIINCMTAEKIRCCTGLMMNKPIIMVVGASSFIGSHLYTYLNAKVSDKYVVKGTYNTQQIFTELEHLDITNKEEIEKLLLFHHPDYILWIAGLKDIRKCEENLELAYAINTKSVENLISVVAAHNLPSRIIHFSSDYVFDGESGNFSETDKPNPKNNYGQTNFLAEKALLASSIDYKIVRPSAVMGKRGIFFGWLVESIINGVELSMFENIYFTPTPISLLNEMIFHVLNKYEEISQKIIHIVGEERLTRYQFAKKIATMLQKERAKIKSEVADFKNVPFLKDLSLAQSEIVKKYQSMSFDDYLMREVISAKGH